MSSRPPAGGRARHAVRHATGHRARDAEAEPEAEPEPVAIARARPARRVSPHVISIALSCLTVIAVVGILAAYLAAVHAIGLGARDERTVGVLSVAALAGYLAMALDMSPRLKPVATFAGWAVATSTLVAVLMPELRQTAGLGTPDAPLLLLSLAGGALSIGLADAALRLRRSEERLATDGHT